MNLNNLKTAILKVPAEQAVFIYVGVGTFAGLRNAEGGLDQQNYHQFPPFLQGLYTCNTYSCNNNKQLAMFLVLIDPIQENPPYLTRDFPLLETNPDEYKNESNTLQVFVFRADVYTEPDRLIHEQNQTQPRGTDITETLRDLNNFAIANRASLLYHDFTGRRTAALAEYFDQELNNEHLDQIVYAMSAREDHGCYFDLSQPTAFFPVRLECTAALAPAPLVLEPASLVLEPAALVLEPASLAPASLAPAALARPIIKMFNYYKFIANNSLIEIAEERLKFTVEMQTLIDAQRDQIIRDIAQRFKEVYMAILRQLYKQILEPEDDFTPVWSLYNSFPIGLTTICKELAEQRDYNLLSDILLEFLIYQLDVFIFLKQLDLSGENMLNFIMADEDPYKWSNNINLFM